MRIQLPYDSCPVAEVNIGGREYRLKLNFAALDRAKKRQGEEKISIYESERMAAYEGAVEAMGEAAGTYEEFVSHWQEHVTTAMFLAIQNGIRSIYYPKSEPSEPDPTQDTPPAQ